MIIRISTSACVFARSLILLDRENDFNIAIEHVIVFDIAI